MIALFCDRAMKKNPAREQTCSGKNRPAPSLLLVLDMVVLFFFIFFLPRQYKMREKKYKQLNGLLINSSMSCAPKKRALLKQHRSKFSKSTFTNNIYLE